MQPVVVGHLLDTAPVLAMGSPCPHSSSAWLKAKAGHWSQRYSHLERSTHWALPPGVRKLTLPSNPNLSTVYSPHGCVSLARISSLLGWPGLSSSSGISSLISRSALSGCVKGGEYVLSTRSSTSKAAGLIFRLMTKIPGYVLSRNLVGP